MDHSAGAEVKKGRPSRARRRAAAAAVPRRVSAAGMHRRAEVDDGRARRHLGAGEPLGAGSAARRRVHGPSPAPRSADSARSSARGRHRRSERRRDDSSGRSASGRRARAFSRPARSLQRGDRSDPRAGSLPRIQRSNRARGARRGERLPPARARRSRDRDEHRREGDERFCAHRTAPHHPAPKIRQSIFEVKPEICVDALPRIARRASGRLE